MNYSEPRKSMVDNQLRGRDIKDELVLKAMEKVPRHEFVPEEHKERAYGDFPVPIGLGQTISQPYVVAAMTEALTLKGGEKILEIGTGSGYQAAVLAEIAKKVYTIERIKELTEKSRETLKKLNYNNVKVVEGDGHEGYKEGFPYDGILVTAACQKIPEQLNEQLNEGGRIVIPIGDRSFQELFVFTKNKGKLEEKFLFDCRFVPMIGASGWNY
ncbi:protein-L-isoaspartate(D-aspartate) O-methyltransferase [Candidatus Woesearchaeota archaeon]|nr:protein-L-isoaspartate(D-aspartate) O-methyltransferase [Candidatus Woesearchaeota archaeon]